jgi:hypothetical protein
MWISDKKLDFWIDHDLNVLFIGEKGVGKTSMVKDAFARKKLNWLYFSSPTMDPWVDFVGVPRAVRDPKTGMEYLDLLLPRVFQDDEVEAMFFDEWNRAPKKVRNACMELIQFKSINGRKFKRLRMIWVAINPDDENSTEYDVEPLDPAQKDRFQVHIHIPYKCSRDYFEGKYGAELAKAAISWWDNLKPVPQKLVSPRRLDYALEIYGMGGDLRDVLPVDDGINVNELLTIMSSGPIPEKLAALHKSGDHKESAAWLRSENNLHAALSYILKKEEYKAFFLPDFPDERLAALIVENEDVTKYVTTNAEVPKFRQILRHIVSARQNEAVIVRIKNQLKQAHRAETVFALTISKPDPPHFKRGASLPYYRSVLNKAKASLTTQNTTYYRKLHYQAIADNLPEQLEVTEAMETLDFVNTFVEKSQMDTILKAGGLIGIVNHCMQRIVAAQGPSTGVAFWRAHRKRWKAIFEHVTSDLKRCERVYNP